MIMAVASNWDHQETGDINCKKDTLQIPKLSRKLSLSDIIAATIGEDARSGDTGYEDFNQDWGIDQPNGCGNIFQTVSCPQDGNSNIDNNQSLFSDNSNNATDPLDNKLFTTGGHQMLYGVGNDSQSAASNLVPEFANTQNSNTKDSFFNENSVDSTIPQQLDFGNVSFSFDSSVGFHTTYDSMNDFVNGLCDAKDSVMNSTLQVVPETNENPPETCLANTDEKQETSVNLSYDSDLEDSVHFVMPEEDTEPFEVPAAESEVIQQPKKRRLSEVSLRTWEGSDFLGNQEALEMETEMAYSDKYGRMQPKHRSRGIHRARSFSGNITHRSVPHNPLLNRSVSSSNFKTPTLNRTRSFSGAATCSPLEEERFNTSLNSLLESPSDNKSLSENPFFDDLKSTLLTACTSTDCPTSLFEALSSGGPRVDVYSRERNLQSRFSTLQSKHPDEVRELSSFYKCQSAEVETERFRELHDNNLPMSFRNHLNQYYDNQLHTIMERVEKSLQLLTVAKRDIITINRSFRQRPLLSRKAVNMMEEWYTRNYEHPYPGQTAVEALATAGEINPEQVKKWFANKRNRTKNTLPVTEVANRRRKRQFSSRW